MGDMNMKCKRVRAELSAFRDGQVAGELRERVRAHLARCAVCSAELQAIDEAARALAGLAPGPLPEDAVQGLLAHVQAGPDGGAVAGEGREARGRLAPRRVASLWLAFASGAAAASLLWIGLGGAPPDSSGETRPGPGARTAGPASVALRPDAAPATRHSVRVERLVVLGPEVVHVPVADPGGTERMRLAAGLLETCAAALRRTRGEREPSHAAPAGPLADLSRPGPAGRRSAAPRGPVASPVPAPARRAPVELAAWTPPTTLRIERDGSSLSLLTHGSVDEVFPALIDRLSDDDPDVRALVHDRLDALRDELEANPNWGPRLSTPPAAESPNPRARPGRDEPGTAAGDDPEVWRRWWAANEMLVVAYEARRPAL